MSEVILGIDLGTTFSAAAYVDDYGRPTVIPNAEGENTTPSIVLIENGQVLVGAAAASQAVAKQEQIVQWIKRSMGNLEYRFEGLGPIEISAEILKKIKTDCASYFAEHGMEVTIDRAVITCPAYFSAIEVDSTIQAGQLAGFDVQEIVREPTAAAVYYGVEHLREGGKLLVCDLGGGTFDASILSLENGTFHPLATAGDRRLGGHDWTSELAHHVAERLIQVFGEDPRIDPVIDQFLYQSCERLKRSFSQSEQGVITIAYKGQTAEVAVTRGEFERITEWLVRQVPEWAERALAKVDPPLAWDQIDDILLVGGATRMRRIAAALMEVSGKKPIQTAEADTMVALGAAILAKGAYRPRRQVVSSGIKKSPVSGLTLIDVKRTAARNFGTRAIVRVKGGLEIQNTVIIPYGTELPAEKIRDDYRLSGGGQDCFDIPVVEFDDMGPDVIQQTYRFRTPPDLPGGAPIKVTFRYDRSGRIAVEAVECHTNTLLAGERVPYEEPDLTVKAPARRVVFAIDVSGSMREYHKIDRARQAVLDNAETLLNTGGGETEIGVVAFGSQANVVCALTSDLDVIRAGVSGLSVYGTTAMDAGLELSLNLLSEVPAGVQRLILLVSDGMPDRPQQALSMGLKIASEGARLLLVDLGGEGINEPFLRDMSADYFHVDKVENLSAEMARLLTLYTPASTVQSGVTWLKGASDA